MALDTSDPRFKKALLIVMLAGGLAYGYHTYMFGPQQEKIDKVAGELEDLESKLDIARIIVQSQDTVLLRRTLEQRNQELELVESLLPESEDISELLEQLTRVADRIGVKSALFEPGPPVQHELYQERPYKVTLHGGYHQVAMFLSDVASLPRIIKPSGLSIVREKNRERPEKEVPTARMTLTTFLLIKSPGKTTGDEKSK
ncbi:MAG: type 4a pilus biogenesis protein PilO [Gemmatimonadota bacterium]|nr:type 4a pilus biogenesis protein PilO [Gemmatimonadota bacterium]